MLQKNGQLESKMQRHISQHLSEPSISYTNGPIHGQRKSVTKVEIGRTALRI